MCGFSQGDDFRVSSWITIGPRPVSRNCQHRVATDDASANGDFTARLRVMSCCKCLAHPMSVNVSFPGSSHDRNLFVKQREFQL
jgi:hypothetical protein